MQGVGPGSPEPLGVTLTREGANVAVVSAHATAVELCLFDAAGTNERARIALPARTGDVFHGFVPGIAAGDRYGLRAHGAYDPRNGHRFNPAKLLVDPYARALDRPFALHAAMFGAGADDAVRDGTDSAPFVPKAIVVAPARPAQATRPRVPWRDTVLYELHVRGFTRAHPGVPEALRGTCAGLAHPAAIAHLTNLGVTTVELMPIAAAIDERHLARLGLSNYWGYNPVALFVPDPRLAPGGIGEVRACVAALQAAGIEVLLDVVLNHTGEGDARGPTVSLRGLDNATYYRTFAGDHARYVDDTGCGNTLALDRPPVLRLALDVLRYYAEAAGVDGFRFDLATTLGRRDAGFDPAAPLLQAIAQDPVLRDLKLVAEPWDVGPGGHRTGAFPAPWGEWNDRYRDTVRRFWRGDADRAGDLATRFAGSADIFAARARAPSRSVNFVTAHDGFTLADLVAYAAKHNEGNGEDNRDGTDANFSWNHGVEGPADDAAIAARRGRDVRNLLATLLTSRGTPMLAMGDELGRTQRGNNNAYAQDNALTWIDWPRADDALVAFTAALVALRKRHPALRQDRWLTGEPVDASGVPDVEWRHPEGRAMNGGDWSDADRHTLVAVLYAGATDTAPADRVAVALNASEHPVTVRLPAAREGFAWRVRVDTAAPSGRRDRAPLAADESVVVDPRSTLVVVEEAEPADVVRRRRGAPADAELLACLANAAGIEPAWWDLAGGRHVVGADTQRALLAAMGLPATSSGAVRDHLAALADARERRALPATVVARAAAPAQVALATLTPAQRRRRALRVRYENGTDTLLHFTLDDLPANVVTAADGRTVAQRMLTLPPLPAGVHTLETDDGTGIECRVLVAPDRCFLPPDLRDGARRFGLAAHLYSLRRRGDQGIGDFTSLALLGEATARAGGSLVGINPLHALFTNDRDRASPYHPSDRRFLDPVYIDVERVPDFADAPAARSLYARHGARIAGLAAQTDVDHGAVWQVKRAILDACFAHFERRARTDPCVAEFERFVAAGGEALRQFALFESIAAAHTRVPWDRWPESLRRPDAMGVADFAARNARSIRCAQYLQWLADRQLAEAAGRARDCGLAFGLYRDLAIGAAPDGSEPWANPGAFALGVSIGAPPDPFSPAGQVWDLPPPNPDAMLASACAGFRDLVAANMRHAGALRIDHVMGLSRLFWIPGGATAAAGAYVRYPFAALTAALALESARARCLVVGEDLGTVQEGLRERLADAAVLSYRVLWFERDGDDFIAPSQWPAQAAACVSTHDLPTIAGWWTGADIDEREALGLVTVADAATERAERQAAKDALAAALQRAGIDLDATAPYAAAVAGAIHRFVGSSASALALLQADDLAGETVALNLPGTDRERANWRRRLAVDVDALWQTEVGVRAAADFARAQRGRT